MLVYERRQKQQMKVVVPQEVVSGLACDGTAISSHHLFRLFPNLHTTLTTNPQLLKFDEDKNEYFTMVDFNLARKFVPNSIYRMVHNDNRKFLAEK
jgi:hypothetical protein